jgi:hypothetical protein
LTKADCYICFHDQLPNVSDVNQKLQFIFLFIKIFQNITLYNIFLKKKSITYFWTREIEHIQYWCV